MSSDLRLRKICIVDDDDAIRESLRLLLETYRYSVTDFASPTAFLNMEDNSAFDCLLVDQHMPGMTGLELIELLHTRRVTTPAILVTGDFDESLSERVVRAKVWAVLMKPVSGDELVAQLGRAMAQR